MPTSLKSAPSKSFIDTAQDDVARSRDAASSPTSGTAGTRRFAAIRSSSTAGARTSFRLSDDADRRDHRHPAAAGDRRHRLRPGPGPAVRPGAARLDDRRRGRDPAGRDPRPPARPGAGRRVLHPRRQVPADRLGPHDHRHREGGRGAAGGGLHAADPRRDPRRDGRGDEHGRRRRDLHPGRGPGGHRDGDRHRDDGAGRPDRRTGQRVRGRGQAAALRRGRHRPVRRADRDPDHRRRRRRPVHLSRSTCCPRPSTARSRRPC